MKKVLLAILITLVWVRFGYASPWDGWSSGGIETAADCNVASYYALDTLCRDTVTKKLYMGNLTGVTEIAAGASGSIATDTIWAAADDAYRCPFSENNRWDNDHPCWWC